MLSLFFLLARLPQPQNFESRKLGRSIIYCRRYGQSCERKISPSSRATLLLLRWKRHADTNAYAFFETNMQAQCM